MPVSKDNVEYFIRNVKLEDAEVLLDIESSVISEGKYFIVVSEELEKKPVQEEKERIQRKLDNEKETLIVAEVDGVVVGSIEFRSQTRKRLSHTGSVSMSISKDYRGMGIGKALLTALLDWAEENPLIEKVSLGVLSTNQRAISLYKQMGFLEEGRLIKEYKLNDGEYIDDILMCKFV
ncbi:MULTISPECIES: GNAT family N-acetyltransferase [Bacillaceae]|uniref:GNAT family N-acetyltransferase n=1 Tax=Bacillaceae TaxID=186817 RepID=UPI001C56C1DB|nr:GNAT family N-acetyltransferase [Rossellomorea sp. YZS02]MBW3111626.1 GNAT family N-acetyltransferase [Bacillus sp. MCCB 382]MDX8342243.1 GNAT family N-acetyltransferase [Rossellomorea sp. YZS02]